MDGGRSGSGGEGIRKLLLICHLLNLPIACKVL